MRLQTATILLCMICASAANAEDRQPELKKDVLLSKELPDGSRLLAQFMWYRERISRPIRPLQRSPGDSEYSARDVNVEQYSLELRRGMRSELVWDYRRELVVGIVEGGRTFAFWDADFVDGNVYIFYCADSLSRVDVATRVGPLWKVVRSEVLMDKSRSAGKGSLFREGNRLGIKYLDEYRYEERWDITGDTLLRKR